MHHCRAFLLYFLSLSSFWKSSCQNGSQSFSFSDDRSVPEIWKSKLLEYFSLNSNVKINYNDIIRWVLSKTQRKTRFILSNRVRINTHSYIQKKQPCKHKFKKKKLTKEKQRDKTHTRILRMHNKILYVLTIYNSTISVQSRSIRNNL